MNDAKSTDKTSTGGSSARRCLKILKLLKGKTLDGLSNTDIAKALGESAPNVCRALAVLEDEGLVHKLESGKWAHSVGMLQIAVAHARCMDEMERKLREISQRVAAGSL